MFDINIETTEEKASYGIGLQLGQQIAGSGLEGLKIDAIAKGIAHAMAGKMPEVDVDDINACLRILHESAEEKLQQAAKLAASAGEAFLTENAKRKEVTVTSSGLQYEVLVQGNGAIPSSDKTVSVHYHGTLVDGTVFDSSVKRGQPAQFPVTGVIKGWVEALQMMPVGSKWKLFIPHQLAYGERGAGASIPPFASLVFEVELLEIL